MNSGNQNQNQKQSRPVRYKFWLNLATFLIWCADTFFTGVFLYILIGPRETSSELYQNPIFWVPFLFAVSLMLQITFTIAPLLISRNSPMQIWSIRLGYADAFTNYVGIGYIVIYFMGVSPGLLIAIETLIDNLGIGEIMTALLIGVAAWFFKNISMVLSEIPRAFTKGN